MEMETKKSGKGLIVLVVILIIMVLGLSGYIVYDKLLQNDGKDNVVQEKDNNTTNVTPSVISSEEALLIGNELWEFAYSTYWGGEPAWKSHTGGPGEPGIVCDTTVEQVKQKYASDFKAQSCLSDDVTCDDYTFDSFIYVEDGCLGAQRGTLQDYKKTSLEVKDIQENKIIFTAKSEYCKIPFCTDSDEPIKEIEKDFIIVKQNNNWLISSFYLPN